MSLSFGALEEIRSASGAREDSLRYTLELKERQLAIAAETLDSVRAARAAREEILEEQDSIARDSLSMARERAEGAQEAVRDLLVSLGASTRALDAHLAADTAALKAKDVQIGVERARTAGAVEELRVTRSNLSLSLEAKVTMKGIVREQEIQITTIEASRRWDKLKQGGLGIVVLGLLVVSLR